MLRPHDFDKADAFRPAGGGPNRGRRAGTRARRRRRAVDLTSSPTRPTRRRPIRSARLVDELGAEVIDERRRAEDGRRHDDEPDGHAQAGAADAGRHGRPRRRRSRTRRSTRRSAAVSCARPSPATASCAAITIDPSVVDPDDIETLEDLVVAAVIEAMRQAQGAAGARSSARSTGGIDLGSMLGGLGGSLEPVNAVRRRHADADRRARPAARASGRSRRSASRSIS